MPPIAHTVTAAHPAPHFTDLSPNKASDLQNRFLTMLVTELKNQDPLNPLDNKDMIAQLAQISTVQGVTQLNQSMKQIHQELYMQKIMQSSSLLGKKVKYPDNHLYWDRKEKISGSLQTNRTSGTVQVLIADSSGHVVRKMALQNIKNRQNFQWDGTNDAGTTVPAGQYTISFHTADGKVAGQFLQENEVQSIGQDENGIVLVFANGRGIHLGEVAEFGKSV